MGRDSNGWQTRLEKKIISIFKGNKILSISVAALTYFYANYAYDANKYLDDLWFSAIEVRIAANIIGSHCTSFMEASEQEKKEKYFYESLSKYNSVLIDKLSTLTTKADEIDRQGREIHTALAQFLAGNWETAEYINRHYKCPDKILTDAEYKKMELRLKHSFPVTFIDYIIFYFKLIFVWKLGFRVFGFELE